MSRNDLVAGIRRRLAKDGEVTLTETSKSWVFLTATDVFKLKKPVRDDLQDLTSLRARHDNTLTEIDLNRRLAPDLYRGAIRLGYDSDGKVTFDRAQVETIDWLVHMDRLPEARMLDVRILAGDGEAELRPMIGQVSDLLCRFYLQAPRSRLSVAELLTVQEDQVNMARDVLLHPEFADMHDRVSAVLDRLLTRIEVMSGRENGARIVECHGDLRPEHLCLTDPPVIFDCLEFNRTLRLSDPFSEVVFLGMECAMLGAGWVKSCLVERLEDVLGVTADAERLRFYEVCHAVVRARLSFAHLLVPEPRTPEKWAPLGLRYLSIAEDFL